MAKLIIRTKYGTVPNRILNDATMSFKSKGLFAYLQSKPADWSFSVDRIALDTTDGRDSVRSGLQELEKAGLLKRKASKNEKGVWDGYDYFLTDIPFTDNPPTGSPLTAKGLTLSKQDSSKKDIVNKTESGFADFWQSYPRKIAKPAAQRAWKHLSLTAVEVDKLLAGLNEWKSSDQWERDGGRYIPHPATFLNQRRWEDEVPKKDLGFISFNK